MKNPRKSFHPRVKPQTGQHLTTPSWSRVGERGLRVETAEDTLARYEVLVSRKFDEIEDIIPADGSIFLILKRGAEASKKLLALFSESLQDQASALCATHEIVVEYGGEAGPDLARLAEQAGLSEADYINSHTAIEYSVAFLGFQPGFPYLRGLPPALHAPRRASPRVQVAAGSVAIGGAYTGIYPVSGPGGWQIIGRTAAVLFDPQRSKPALMQPGDRVRFVSHD